jgi:hypothetical protein
VESPGSRTVIETPLANWLRTDALAHAVRKIANECRPVHPPFSSCRAVNPGCGFTSLNPNPLIVLIG